MMKIREVQFIEHPILGNLRLDCCDENGNPVDTIIFAGENGVGKSTVLEALYNLLSRNSNWYRRGLQSEAGISRLRFGADVLIEINGALSKIEYRFKPIMGGMVQDLFMMDGKGLDAQVYAPQAAAKYSTFAIFSDVAINFSPSYAVSVTSMQLDAEETSRKSDAEIASQINQLIIDVQALDDADFATAARQNPNSPAKDLMADSRMRRFTDAFDRFFDNIRYDRVKTLDGHREVVFKKGEDDIALDSLSSGEKQIVFRGCFLLKDAEALRGAFVFIDEPEISLHPLWQIKIMDFYKSIFTDNTGEQSSQIFVATHSPFVIHNDTRKNDKVIVLARDADGKIFVKDNPEYYKCNSIEAVQDAFSTSMFLADKPTVYVEGQTDEKYINRALKVFDISPQFEVKWIGYLDENGQERNTGDKALTKGFEFCCSQPQSVKRAFLYDCDTKHEERATGMVAAFIWPKRDSSNGMKRGIENLISFEGIGLDGFYSTKEEIGDYGEKKIIQSLNKMDLCKHICGLDDEELKERFSALRPTLGRLSNFFSGQ